MLQRLTGAQIIRLNLAQRFHHRVGRAVEQAPLNGRVGRRCRLGSGRLGRGSRAAALGVALQFRQLGLGLGQHTVGYAREFGYLQAVALAGGPLLNLVQKDNAVVMLDGVQVDIDNTR